MSRSPNRRLITALLVLATAAASAQPQTGDRQLIGLPVASLDSLARAAVAEHGLPSVVIGVTVGGTRTVVGVGEVHGAVPDSRTPYEIGSVSKVLTSLALADAVVRGETMLETPVADLLGSPVGAHTGGPIRLVDLATHTSGLPQLDFAYAYSPAFDLDNPYAGYTTDLLRTALTQLTPMTEPGASYGYSNLGAGLLGYALAHRAESTYEGLVDTRVLTPLGLDDTWIAADDSTASRLAPAHGADGEAVSWWTFTDASAGAGAWRSTAADMLTLIEAAIHPSQTDLADALALALTEHHDAGQPQSVGLGWHSIQTAAGPMWWHNGMVGGSTSHIAAIPEARVGVVVLTNRQSGAVDALAQDVLRGLLAE